MKKKLMKRVISILLSVAVLCCAAGAEGLLISAENRYDITLTITYPRSGEAPEIPSDFESLSSLDLTYLGCEWKTADNTEQWDDGTEFIEWMYTFVNSRNYNSLNTFEDGIMYHQRTYFKIANVSVSGEDEAAVTLVDSATNQQFNSSEVYLINGEELISEFGGAVALPSGITANDSLMYIDTGALIGSPWGHMHTESSEYTFDDQNHWKVCPECGIKLADTVCNHSSSYGILERWTSTQSATETRAGIWQKT